MSPSSPQINLASLLTCLCRLVSVLRARFEKFSLQTRALKNKRCFLRIACARKFAVKTAVVIRNSLRTNRIGRPYTRPVITRGRSARRKMGGSGTGIKKEKTKERKEKRKTRHPRLRSWALFAVFARETRDLKLHLNKAICARAVIQFGPLASSRCESGSADKSTSCAAHRFQHAPTM